MNGPRVWNVLFLCTGNSARSILGEAILSHLGGERFRAYSAGSHPTGQVNPGAIALLGDLGFDVSVFRSKSWDEFSGSDAPVFDIVFIVCDNAAKEACPVWVGSPINVHWGLPDPAVFEDEQARREAFDECHAMLTHRIRELVELDIDQLTREELRSTLESVGQTMTKPKDNL